MRRILVPLIFAVFGCAILISLGLWQLRRAEEKTAYIAGIEAAITAPADYLPDEVDPSMKYRPVWVEGRTTGQEIDVVSGSKVQGAGYQVISAFETREGRRILIDRGFVPQQARHEPRPPVALSVTGNLHWPDEAGGSVPAPNLAENIWFARDVPAMAEALGTEPVLIVASWVEGDAQGITPLRLGVESIPNNHMNYAVQWFLFAATLAIMTAWLIWRIRRRTY
ncbi:MAG: SURF1 family protein [Paracoccus sp. (in: a-proteobacteria)]|nr:SURF1 family protein [Paracoccus sp. (in: a-proteobacteria)]